MSLVVSLMGIVCSSSELDKINPQANTAMADHAQRYLDLDILQKDNESSLIFDIRKSIYLLLPMGRATIDQVAQTHEVNVRNVATSSRSRTNKF